MKYFKTILFSLLFINVGYSQSYNFVDDFLTNDVLTLDHYTSSVLVNDVGDFCVNGDKGLCLNVLNNGNNPSPIVSQHSGWFTKVNGQWILSNQGQNFFVQAEAVTAPDNAFIKFCSKNPSDPNQTWYCTQVFESICFQPGESSICGPLPAELIEYEAFQVDATSVQIYWASVNEVNVERWVLSRSSDLRSFIELVHVSGADEENSINDYIYIDRNTSSGYNYYKLESIDFDGTVQDHGYRTVFIQKEEQINIFGTGQDSFTIDYNMDHPSKLSVFTFNGRLLSQQDLPSGSSRKVINMEDIPQGMYIINVTSPNNSVSKQLFLSPE